MLLIVAKVILKKQVTKIIIKPLFLVIYSK